MRPPNELIPSGVAPAADAGNHGWGSADPRMRPSTSAGFIAVWRSAPPLDQLDGYEARDRISATRFQAGANVTTRDGGAMKILIVYGTTEGHTATLVERMRSRSRVGLRR